ncbi:MAG: type I glutamate--ammonia ligase [Candidatus Aenigmarchaeota archaeon]|nr:type I glutamate--ammonia ligase [Candidatus Aenigmarchaeota archaeon]
MHNNLILDKIKKDRVKFISIQFSDLFGVVKEIIIQSKDIKEALENGIWFDGSSIEGFARIEESDLFLRPDPKTYSIVPWSVDNGKTARMICDVFRPNGKPFEGDPRYILKKIIAKAGSMNFEYNVGPEPEFYIFKNVESKIEPIDRKSYFDFSSNGSYDLIKQIIESLKMFGINVETSHHEVGNGQYEIDFNYGPALSIADRLITLKYTVKKIAQMNELKATFMPKPIKKFPGSGMHVHQSLFINEKNIFYDKNDKYNLSEIAYNFIGGQMNNIKSMCAILCPTINSYKRLVSGFEAPIYITWSRMNRSALVRVPKWFNTKPNSARIELRCPDSTSNPYLAFAVMLKAGLEGIDKKMRPPDPIEDNVYGFDSKTLAEKNIGVLPTSLEESLNELKKAGFIRELFGEETFDKYIKIKKSELSEFKRQVTNWEIKKYFDSY